MLSPQETHLAMVEVLRMQMGVEEAEAMALRRRTLVERLVVSVAEAIVASAVPTQGSHCKEAMATDVLRTRGKMPA